MKIIWSWIIIKEKRVLLIKRSKNKLRYTNMWAFPWWRLEEWETPKQTAIREIKEEVWLNFEIEKLHSDNIIWEAHFYDFLWTATWNAILQEEECDWYWWFTYAETKYLPMWERIEELIEIIYVEKLID